jgi:uncharacterized protein
LKNPWGCSTLKRMMRLFPVLAALILLMGCRDGQSLELSPGPARTQAEPKGQPQPKLPTINLWIGPLEMTAEQALTRDQIVRGMMFRTEMGENEGMLFVFPNPHRASFWMRNTLIPLSCAYISPEGVILEIKDMKPLDETPLTAASDQVQYVLETPLGWFERNKITPGVTIRTERGSLAETYFGRRRG